MAAERPVLLIGGVRKGEDAPLLLFAERALAAGLVPAVVTARDQAAMPTADGRSLAARLEDLGIAAVHVLDGRLDAGDLRALLAEGGVGVSLNSHRIFGADVVEMFAGRLINYHNTLLPKERGAAAYSWRMMMGRRDTGLSFHRVDAGIDTGDVVMQRRLTLPDSSTCVADDYAAIAGDEAALFADMAALIASGDDWPRLAQDEDVAEYWPRLDTELNGFVDWRWGADAIVRFIRAFDRPYAGASSYLGETRVRLRRARHVGADGSFHPFQAGLIYRQRNGETFIAAGGGAVAVAEIEPEADGALPGRLLGRRLHTPAGHLETAMLTRPTF